MIYMIKIMKIISFFLPDAILSIDGIENYWHCILASQPNWSHGRGLGGIITICQPTWNRSRTISQGIDRGETYHDDKYYEMIIIDRARGIICCISGRHSEIHRPQCSVSTRSIVAIVQFNCRTPFVTIAEIVSQIPFVAFARPPCQMWPNAFSRPCDVPGLRDYNLRGGTIW